LGVRPSRSPQTYPLNLIWRDQPTVGDGIRLEPGRDASPWEFDPPSLRECICQTTPSERSSAARVLRCQRGDRGFESHRSLIHQSINPSIQQSINPSIHQFINRVRSSKAEFDTSNVAGTGSTPVAHFTFWFPRGLLFQRENAWLAPRRCRFESGAVHHGDVAQLG
jgi:hypothetical protein